MIVDPQALAAHEFLGSLDDPLAPLARGHGPVDFAQPSHGVAPPDHLGRLTLSIVGQVISTSAAIGIFGRLTAQLGGSITAEALARCGEEELRAVGLTRAKARAVHGLGVALITGGFSFDQFEQLTDAEAESRLTALPGIGPWSAQMFLLRSLRRPDVFPAGDLGLRRALETIDALDSIPSVPHATERALAWRPYRSYAAKCLWLHYTRGVTVAWPAQHSPGHRRAGKA